MNSDHAKTELRRSLKLQRDAFLKSKKNIANQSIMNQLLTLPGVCQAATAYLYVSTDTEVDTHRLIDALESRGIVILVPRIIDRTEMRAVRFPGWRSMQAGPLGILAPPDDTPWIAPIDVAIVPGLGFSIHGDRLGFGAGYYDRWLVRHPETLKIGVAFDDQILEELPVGGHDVSMDLIVTENRVVEITT